VELYDHFCVYSHESHTIWLVRDDGARLGLWPCWADIPLGRYVLREEGDRWVAMSIKRMVLPRRWYVGRQAASVPLSASCAGSLWAHHPVGLIVVASDAEGVDLISDAQLTPARVSG
jgi:hypothetical protein